MGRKLFGVAFGNGAAAIGAPDSFHDRVNLLETGDGQRVFDLVDEHGVAPCRDRKNNNTSCEKNAIFPLTTIRCHENVELGGTTFFMSFEALNASNVGGLCYLALCGQNDSLRIERCILLRFGSSVESIIIAL